MQVDSNFFTILEKFEGCVLCPYLDQVKIPTIGIGTTRYEDGTSVKTTDVCISHDRAEQLVRFYVSSTENEINTLVKQSLNQNQFDSLCSFIYNIGQEGFAKSTLLKKINANPNDPSIKDEFMKWTHAGGKVLSDLVNRRRDEANLYFQPV